MSTQVYWKLPVLTKPGRQSAVHVLPTALTLVVTLHALAEVHSVFAGRVCSQVVGHPGTAFAKETQDTSADHSQSTVLAGATAVPIQYF
jgi:hypothetical protein